MTAAIRRRGVRVALAVLGQEGRQRLGLAGARRDGAETRGAGRVGSREEREGARIRARRHRLRELCLEPLQADRLAREVVGDRGAHGIGPGLLVQRLAGLPPLAEQGLVRLAGEFKLPI